MIAVTSFTCFTMTPPTPMLEAMASQTVERVDSGQIATDCACPHQRAADFSAVIMTRGRRTALAQRAIRIGVDLNHADIASGANTHGLTIGSRAIPEYGDGPQRRRTIRIQATDLKQAQRLAEQIHSDTQCCAADSDYISVLLDVEIVTAQNFMIAFEKFTESPLGRISENELPCYRYIGTPHGLAGLILDICTTRVADGVVLRPLNCRHENAHVAGDISKFLDVIAERALVELLDVA